MNINKVATYNAELYRRTQTNQMEQRNEERRLEERHNKQIAEISDQKRIEMNRYMNRPGQNVDRMA